LILDKWVLTSSLRKFQITYKVAYNYNSLNESVKGSDDAISSTIGNVTALKNALEQDNNFTASNYSVIEDGFNFSGKDLELITCLIYQSFKYFFV